MTEKTKKNMCYIRRGKRVLGPYPVGQAQKFLILGRISFEDEVSFDRKQWSNIGCVPSFIPRALRDKSAENQALLARAQWREDERSGECEHHSDGVKQDRRRPEASSVVMRRTQKTDQMKKRLIMKERSKWPVLVSFMVAGLVLCWGVWTSLQEQEQVSEPTCRAPAAIAMNWSGCRKDKLDLANVDLQEAILTTAKFNQSNLKGAMLADVQAEYADFGHADLSYAVLDGGHFKGASFRYADLSYVKLEAADLSYADLTGANLGGASLEGTNFSHTIWFDGRMCLLGSVGGCSVRGAQ